MSAQLVKNSTRRGPLATFARYMMGCGFDFRISIFPMKGERPTGGFRILGARRSQRQPAYA